jgi:hypothetical protein
MLKTPISVAIFATLAAFVPPGQASAQGSASNLSGTYRCSPDLIDTVQHAENQDNYPPYDIARAGEDTYRISLAVAGFPPEDLTVTVQQNLLTVSGRKSENSDRYYLYQAFRRGHSSAASALRTVSRSRAPGLRTGCCKLISCAECPKP